MAYFSALGGTGGTSATITVTYSEDFYGVTITATNGTTTLTKTATSSGTLVFDVSEGGTWVVSGTVEGATYSESVDVTFEYTAPPLVALPDGSTALPVNDIQMWLKCAAIRDKTTYTTLADVLADTETLIALCADSNASDYMARSTTWASGVTADATAMQIVGMYGYCANALRNDNTWNTAINNSAYASYVPVSPVVPTGTVIHSAVEDTTYYVSGGSNVPFCTIASGDTETVLASTIESLKNQTVTLYSSVAKDSTNLSNDYSKAVRITPNVTEIYLMPDGAVYWYGHTSQTLGKTVWIGSSAGNNFTYNKNNMSASTTGSNQNNTATTTSKVFVSGNKIKYIRGDSHDDSGALKVKEASVVENIERYVGLGYRTGTGGVGIYVIHSTSTGQVNTGSDTNATENEGFVGLSGTLTVYALWYE